MERVATLEIEGEVVAYPFRHLQEQPVVADIVGGVDVVVFYKPGTASALDLSSIADSADVGSAAIFRSTVDGRALTFRAEGDVFIDEQTGSTWDIFGRAIEGPLQGSELQPLVSGSDFWFAWAAFKPETRIWEGP